MVTIVSIADPGLGNTSYVVDLGDGSALVVDPERDPRPYVEAAEERGLVVRHVAETHLHADFVSGARELVSLGARLIAPRRSLLAHPHVGVDDGEEVAVGDLALRVMSTPGHTPEHVSYLLVDGARPITIFTGGALMAGGVARPDLISTDLTVRLAQDAYRSARRMLETLPGELEIRPTHGGGSFCSSASAPRGGMSTIAAERLAHPAARASDAGQFVAELLDGLGTYPSYFLRLREVNREGPEVHGPELSRLAAVTPEDLEERTVVDARPIDRFASSHIPGAVSIELREQFGTWLGWLFEPDVPLVFVLDDDQDERELVRQALNVGHEAIVGRIRLEEWVAAGGKPATIELASADAIRSGAPVLDVRQQSEWELAHVPGARHVELGALRSGAAGIEAGSVVHCGHGQRAMTGASLLRRHGVDGVSVTTGGPAEITAALAVG